MEKWMCHNNSNVRAKKGVSIILVVDLLRGQIFWDIQEGKSGQTNWDRGSR